MTREYAGTELDLFAKANNWKSYWSSMIRPYLGNRILDVGAGIGGTAKLFRDVPFESYVALEPDASFVERMKVDASLVELAERFQPKLGTIGELANEELFDTILYIDVLEHITDDREELERASAHLMRGGKIVVLSPAHAWLHSEFDMAVGHVRRYKRSTLVAAKPAGLVEDRTFYLDSVGLIASLGNRLALRASAPSEAQIRIWDGGMVPISRVTDRLTNYRLGKTIVAIFGKPRG